MYLSGATPLCLWRTIDGYGPTAQCAPVDRGGRGQPASQERATAGAGAPVTAALASPGVLRRYRGRRSIGRPPIALAVVMAATGAFVALLFIAGFHSVLASGQHDVDALEARLTAGRGQAQILRMEVARLESPGRILNVARGRLGMGPSQELFYLEAVVPGDPRNPVPAPGDDPFGWARP